MRKARLDDALLADFGALRVRADHARVLKVIERVLIERHGSDAQSTLDEVVRELVAVERLDRQFRAPAAKSRPR